jgi:diacylglycerol kinase (ATP)
LRAATRLDLEDTYFLPAVRDNPKGKTGREPGLIMRIYLNPQCDYGKGLARWQKIEPKLRQKFETFEAETITSPEYINKQIQSALQTGERYFVAAGGDGTVNLLFNALMTALDDTSQVILGAIGLGSSNDFHKPFHHKNFINDIPVRLSLDQARAYDVIGVNYQNSHGETVTQYALINARIGITAQANAIYNARLPYIEWLQKWTVGGAILASALHTIFTYRNIPCQIVFENSQSHSYLLTNLGIIKNPHFAGDLCYDTPIKPDDGMLGVNLCADMNLLEALYSLVRLHKHHFLGRPKTHTWSARKVSVLSDYLFALEMDGEVVHTRHASFSVIPKAIRCCP